MLQIILILNDIKTSEIGFAYLFTCPFNTYQYIPFPMRHSLHKNEYELKARYHKKEYYIWTCIRNSSQVTLPLVTNSKMLKGFTLYQRVRAICNSNKFRIFLHIFNCIAWSLFSNYDLYLANGIGCVTIKVELV